MRCAVDRDVPEKHDIKTDAVEKTDMAPASPEKPAIEPDDEHEIVREGFSKSDGVRFQSGFRAVSGSSNGFRATPTQFCSSRGFSDH